LRVAPHGRARVVGVSAHGAEVVVEQGSLAARITPGVQTAWAMRAGPFRVQVTGTEFDLGWEPVAQRFELVVREGSVKVTGPHLPADRSVVAGERLVVAVPEGRAELARGGPEPIESAAPSLEVTASDSDGGEASDASPQHDDRAVNARDTTSSPSSVSRGIESWREHLRAGRHREALAAAERQGFASVLEAATQAELWQLVDAARFSGKPARAVETLQTLRARGVRGNTAFMLGKIAADQQGAPGPAATWFQTYLTEAPSGALAEEALGRLMQLQRRSDPAAATATAKRYLARYPKGAYSGLAKSLKSR
jgi:hypothetical protein